MGDTTPPTAQAGGVNLTPTVSRSTPPRGMLPGSAGISSASMELCLEGTYWDCIYLQGSVSVRGE